MNIQSSKKLSKDTRIWFLIALSILFITMFRGIHSPTMYAYSSFLLNYDFGFIKRGLVGSIFSSFSNPYFISYDFFVVFGAVLLVANIILLGNLLRSFFVDRNPLLIGLALVFCSSMAVVLFARSIGSFDHIGLLITLLIVQLNGFTKKYIACLFLLPLSLLIHEGSLIIFFPVIFMSLLMAFDIKSDGFFSPKVLLIAVLGALCLGIATLASSTILTEEQAQLMFETTEAKLSHPINIGAFFIHTKDTMYNFITVTQSWLDPIKLLSFAVIVLVTAPTNLAILSTTFIVMRKNNMPRYIIFLAIFSSVSSLLMNFLGYDVNRWHTLSIMTSLIMLYIVIKELGMHKVKLDNSIKFPLLVFLIFLNGASYIFIYAGYEVQMFPFGDHLKYWIEVLQGSKDFPYLPIFELETERPGVPDAYYEQLENSKVK